MIDPRPVTLTPEATAAASRLLPSPEVGALLAYGEVWWRLPDHLRALGTPDALLVLSELPRPSTEAQPSRGLGR